MFVNIVKNRKKSTFLKVLVCKKCQKNAKNRREKKCREEARIKRENKIK